MKIAELKRPPSRHARSRDIFLEDQLTRMRSAQDDLNKQVDHAFSKSKASASMTASAVTF